MTSEKKLKRRIRQLEKELAKAYLEQAPPVSVPESTRPYTFRTQASSDPDRDWFYRVINTDIPLLTSIKWGWSNVDHSEIYDSAPDTNTLRVDDDGRMTWTTEEGIAGEA